MAGVLLKLRSDLRIFRVLSCPDGETGRPACRQAGALASGGSDGVDRLRNQQCGKELYLRRDDIEPASSCAQTQQGPRKDHTLVSTFYAVAQRELSEPQ